jgi:DUF971 family protein
MNAEPKSVRVNKTTGTGMEIDWKDGHQSVYKFHFLRDACPCALCDDEREKSGADFGEPPRPKPGALPMYRDPARPTEVSAVGKYAISFVWNDGHTNGIYSWEYLRMLCPCDECKAIRAEGGKLVAGGSGAIFDR